MGYGVEPFQVPSYQGGFIQDNIYSMARSCVCGGEGGGGGGLSSAMYLGVDISRILHVNWNTHVNKVAANANKSLGNYWARCEDQVPQNPRNGMQDPFSSLAGVRFSSVGPHINEQTHIFTEFVQRRAARLTTNAWNRTTSVTSLLHQLNWQSGPSLPLLQYRNQPNYRTCSYKRTVKQFSSL